jgi:hypothetical protein
VCGFVNYLSAVCASNDFFKSTKAPRAMRREMRKHKNKMVKGKIKLGLPKSSKEERYIKTG